MGHSYALLREWKAQVPKFGREIPEKSSTQRDWSPYQCDFNKSKIGWPNAKTAHRVSSINIDLE